MLDPSPPQKATVISGILFAFSIVASIVLIALGLHERSNWTARIMVAGWGAIFTSALLFQLLLQTKWSAVVRRLAVGFNALVVCAALLVLSSLVWNAAW